jgi:hypothetical protein
MRKLKLWHYILLAAATGVVPMTVLLLYVISTSVNKDINFGTQEMRGDTFQRPLEQLLDLFPRYQAAARQVLAGDDSANTSLTGLQQQIDEQLQTLSANYNGEMGRASEVHRCGTGCAETRQRAAFCGSGRLAKSQGCAAGGGCGG